MNLPDTVARFVADTQPFDRPLDTSTRKATEFGRSTERASLAARKALLSAAEASTKAATAQEAAAEAAQKYERGEIGAAEAARRAADATHALERANIAERESSIASANAADKAADNYRQLARDAELAGAAERLAALKSSGLVKDHNNLLKDLEARFGSLEKEGGGAFQAIGKEGSSAFSSIGSSGPGAIALVVAALAAVPFAATAVEGAVTLGIGGALAGLGLYATKGDQEVQAALHGMAKHVGDETKQIAAPFKATWIEIAKEGSDVFDQLAPELKKDFAELAPVVSNFVHYLGDGLEELSPMFHAVANSADKLLSDLGPKLPEIFGNIGSAASIMADSIAKNPAIFNDMLVNASKLLPVLAHLLDWAVKVGPIVSPAFDTLEHGTQTIRALAAAAGGIGGIIGTLTGHLIGVKSGGEGAAAGASLAKSGLDLLAQASGNADAKIYQVHGSTLQTKTAMDLAALAADKMAAAFDRLTGANQSEYATNIQFKQALIAANQALKDNGKTLSDNTAKGLANRQALLNVAKAAQDHAAAMKAAGRSTNDVSAALSNARAKLVSMAERMNYSSAEANRLADQLLGVRSAANKIPTQKQIDVRAHTAQATGDIMSFIRWASSQHVDIGLQTHMGYAGGGLVGGYAKGGVAGFPAGGQVHGPGTSTSDSIPARLSDGEFVVNARAAKSHLALLRAINSGAPGYASGGTVATQGGSHWVSVPASVTVPTQGGNLGSAQWSWAALDRLKAAMARPEHLAALAAQQSLAAMRRSMTGSGLGAGIGSGHGTTVQHITNVSLNVGGSIRSDRDIVAMLQSALLRGRITTTLPAGR